MNEEQLSRKEELLAERLKRIADMEAQVLKKEKALNPDLWETLLGLCETHNVEFVWVKGHAQNPYNNRCDELAVAQSQRYK